MAFVKQDGTLPQLIASGDTDPVDLTDARGAAFTLIHDNGSGSVTDAAVVQPMISHDGTTFFPSGGAFTFGTGDGEIGYRDYPPIVDSLTIKAVRFAYTAPSGPTGATLDVAYSLFVEE